MPSLRDFEGLRVRKELDVEVLQVEAPPATWNPKHAEPLKTENLELLNLEPLQTLNLQLVSLDTL